MSVELYSLALKIGFLMMVGSSLIVVINAILSAREMGGTLGQGLKKIAAGTIFHTILIATYFFVERGNMGILTDDQIRLYFVILGITGSTLLIVGYFQIYKISKKLKLFTA